MEKVKKQNVKHKEIPTYIIVFSFTGDLQGELKCTIIKRPEYFYSFFTQ